MSADNGIYILETEGPEYRVAHLQNIEDIWYDSTTKEYTNGDNDVAIRNARGMWTGDVLSKEGARNKAFLMEESIYQQGYPLEYGISNIKIPRWF